MGLFVFVGYRFFTDAKSSPTDELEAGCVCPKQVREAQGVSVVIVPFLISYALMLEPLASGWPAVTGGQQVCAGGCDFTTAPSPKLLPSHPRVRQGCSSPTRERFPLWSLRGPKANGLVHVLRDYNSREM